MRIVTWDIETSPIIAPIWTLWNANTAPQNIIRQSELLCASFHDFENKDSTKRMNSFKRNADPNGDFGLTSEKQLIQEMRDYMEDIDVLVHHNGDKFDMKKFTAKLIKYNLEPLPKILTIDTLYRFKQIATLESAKLDNLAFEFFGDRKMFTGGMKLWLQAMSGDQKAMDKMSRYCEKDVVLTTKLYRRLRPHIKNHPNMSDSEVLNCIRCNAPESFMVWRKTRRTNAGIEKHQYQCRKCNGYTTARKSVKEKPLGVS